LPAFYGTRRSQGLPLVCVASKMNPVHSEIPSLFKTLLVLFLYLRLELPNGLFPSGFLTEILYAFLFPPLRAVPNKIIRR
jgi:hypothetical protein